MKWSNEQLLVDETLYFTGNGYIGIRGNFEEGYDDGYDSIRGTYINGFYETTDVTYGESAYGFPKTAQKMVNVTDCQDIRVIIGDEEVNLFTGQVLEMRRDLDINQGLYTRKVHWRSPKGKEVILTYKRMTSFVTLELALFQVTVESVNYEGPLGILSGINGDVENYTNPNDPRVASGHAKLLTVTEVKANEKSGSISSKTKRSNHRVTSIIGHSEPGQVEESLNRIQWSFRKTLIPGSKEKITKYVVFTDSIRHQDPCMEGMDKLERALELDFEDHALGQKKYLDEFWKYSKIRVKGNPSTEEALNYSVYQLLSSAGKDPHSNICAKGLSGEGYEGHYFWDTEVYMLPFFTLTNPAVAKNLMKFRYETLPYARERAKEMGHKIGAKVPWRTIKGTECSAYFPAGSAQYHINSDVAFSYIQYYLLHRDMDFLKEFGLEVLYETARIWLDMGHFNDDGDFMIHCVTGPDEYTAIVNNNYYTNAMAKYHMTWTVKLAKDLRDYDEDAYMVLMDKINGSLDELSQMEIAAGAMYFEYDEKIGVFMQDDSFKNKPTWDFAGTPKENYPLLLHYHPLTIYRHKVLKQADTLLAMLLIDDATLDVFERCYDFYEPLTTHDSSLSPCVYSMAASRIKRSHKAYEFFNKTLRLDLDNLHHNTKDGLHIANAGGAYMAVVYGFAGLRIKSDGLHLNPHLPEDLEGVSFSVNHGGHLIHIELGQKILVRGEVEVKVYIYDQPYILKGHLEVDYE